jgi:uncharacterized DUF497 family protein
MNLLTLLRFGRLMPKCTHKIAGKHLTMKPFRWSAEKNEQLRQERGVSFEEITAAAEAGGLVDVVAHPNPGRYPAQRILVVQLAGYAYLVPFVEEADALFLKTIIPSRKATRDFIRREPDDDPS